MKKKLFTLLTLMMCAWGTTLAQSVMFSSDVIATSDQSFTSGSTTEITSTYATTTGGKIYAINGNKDAKNLIGHQGTNYMFCITNNDTSFKIELDNPLAVGDVISAKTYSRTDTELGLFISTETSRPSSCDTKLSIAKVASAAYEPLSNYTVTAVDGLVGATTIYIYRETGKSTYFDEFTITSSATATAEVLKTSAAVKVDDSALTLDAATNGYSISSTTITLSDDITSLTTPSNVELVKTITYSDATTKDEDVTVTFDGTITAGYYVGTATIGLTGSETTYTVRVKQETSPTAVLSATSGAIAITNSYTVVGTTTVTLTGGNLTDGTYDVTADVAGTTISPSSFTVSGGVVSQEFTITSSASSAATTVFTFGSAAMGATAPTFTLTYSKTAQRGLSQTDVTGSTTWDWTKAGSNTVELTDATKPTKSEEFLMADLAEVNNDANFNSQALKVVCQFPTRGTNYYFQGNIIKFTTTVPGIVKVTFSNTGKRDDSNANRRYLYINDTNTGVYTLNTTMTTATANVPAGEVIINAYTGEDASTMVRISKIEFTACEAISTLADRNYASYVTTNKLDFSAADGITAYIATGLNGTADAVVLEEVSVVPAGTPIIVKTDVKDDAVTINVPVTTAAADDVAANKLVAGDGTTVANSDYYFLKEDLFHLATSGTLQSGKAYLQVASPARELSIVFADDTVTSINEELRVKNEESSDAIYNLSGQRVAQPQKGLYIINGKKVMVK